MIGRRTKQLITREMKDIPGNPEKILVTGEPRRGSPTVVVPMNGGMGPSFPASFGGFEENPFQEAIDLFQSSLWMKLLAIGGTVLILYYASKKKGGGDAKWGRY